MSLSKNKQEILYNLINSGIAGGIAFFSGLLASGDINVRVITVSVAAAGLVALQKFKSYWDSEAPEYQKKILNFF